MSHSKRGHRDQRKPARRGVPAVPAGPSAERARQGCRRPEGADRDPRYTHRCGAPGEAGRGRSVPVGPRTRPVGPQLLSAAVAGGSWGTSPAQGRCLAAEKAVPARPAKRAGTPALRSASRGGPPPPSVCGLPAAATAPTTAIAAAAGAATTAARPGTRRGLMLSSAAPPPLWTSGAAKLLHIRGPAPPRPLWSGSVTPPSRHVTTRGGGDEASPAERASAARE